MREEGLISAEYLETFPLPLVNDFSEANLAVVSSLEREFEVVERKVVTEDFPPYQRYRETGNLEAYATEFVGFSRAYLYPYLKGMCTKGEEGEALIQLFFTKLEDNIRNRPEPMRGTQSYFHLRKIS